LKLLGKQPSVKVKLARPEMRSANRKLQDFMSDVGT